MNQELERMEAEYSIIRRDAGEAREQARQLTEQEIAMRRPLAVLRCQEFGQKHQIDLYFGAALRMTPEAREYQASKGNRYSDFSDTVYLGNIFNDGCAQIQAEDPSNHDVGGMLNVGFPHDLIIRMRKAYLED